MDFSSIFGMFGGSGGSGSGGGKTTTSQANPIVGTGISTSFGPSGRDLWIIGGIVAVAAIIIAILAFTRK